MIARPVARCLRLLNLLQSRIAQSVAELACELGVSRRTVFRDFRVLQDAGIPVRYDAQRGGHIIVPHFYLKAPKLTHDELVILLMAAHTSLLSSSRELKHIITQSISKLLMEAPADVQEEVSRLMKSCVVESSYALWPTGEDGVCVEIITAIRQRRRVRITYHLGDESGQLIKTAVAPYRMVASPGGWYLIGRSSLHRMVRSFDLQHIHHAEMIGDRFNLPEKYQRPVPVCDLVRDLQLSSDT